MKLQQPPSEFEIEQSVIASIFLHPDERVIALELLNDEDFYSTQHKIIFEKIRELHKNSQPVGIDTVWAGLTDEKKEKLKSAVNLQSLLDKVPPSHNIEYHIGILKNHSALRQGLKQAYAIEKECYRNNGDLTKVADNAQLIIDEVKRAKSGGMDVSKFEFVHGAEIIKTLKPVDWRIHGIMEDNAFYYSFGDAGSYKTFVELDRLLCVAAGIDYHDHKVKQGTVFYIAGEGQQGVGRRIAAWHIARKTNAADVPFFLAKTPTQLMDPGAVDDVRRAVDALAKEYGNPAVIHIDTLARNFGDGDENATKDMNRVISNLDSAFGNDIGRGLTHHSGHANKDRARGAYALHCAADEAFRIVFRDGKVLVETKKMKDAPLSAPMLFNRKEIKLVIGDQYDSSYVLELEAEGDDVCILPETQTKKASGNMADALNLLKQMYAEYEQNLAGSDRDGDMPSVSNHDWKKACIQQKIYKKASNFERAAERMLLRNLIIFDNAKHYVYPIEIFQEYNCDDF